MGLCEYAHVCSVPTKNKENVEPHGIVVTRGHVLPCSCWEQKVLCVGKAARDLTAGPLLQAPCVF